MSGRWWRAYDEAVDDPKLQRLGPVIGWAWFNLMCITSKNGGALPPIGDVAFKLRTTEQRAAATITALVSAGLFERDGDGQFVPHNWSARQFQSDVTDPTNATRQKRYRDRLRNGQSTVTDAVTVKRPDTESEADTEPEGTETAEIPKTPISENLADASGGRKPTRPSIDGFFDEFWKVYPKRGDAANPKKPARDKFERAIKAGTDPAQIIAAAQRYCDIESTAGRSNTEKIAQAVTWLSQQRWNDYPQAAPAGAAVPPDPSMPSDAELRARYAPQIHDTKPEDEGLFREGSDTHSADQGALRHPVGTA